MIKQKQLKELVKAAKAHQAKYPDDNFIHSLKKLKDWTPNCLGESGYLQTIYWLMNELVDVVRHLKSWQERKPVDQETALFRNEIIRLIGEMIDEKPTIQNKSKQKRR